MDQGRQPTATPASLEPLGFEMNGSKIHGVDGTIESKPGFASIEAIHSSAANSQSLTTFNEFAPPPTPTLDDAKSRESTLSNIYSRIKATVAPAEEAKPKSRPPSADLRASSSLFRQGKGNEARADASSTGNGEAVAVTPSSSRQSPELSFVKGDESPSARRKRPRSLVSAATLSSLDPESAKNSAQASPSKPGNAAKEPSKAATTPSPQAKARESTAEAKKEPGSSNASGSVTPVSLSLATPRHELLRAFPGKASSTPSELSLGPTGAKAVTTSEHAMAGQLRINRPVVPVAQAPAPNALIYQMSQKILSRDFWLKDENAKSCFHCGESFTTFKRKHHCRLCGQIYCNSCTHLISGKPFGQSSKLRVCKTCNAMLHDDDSSDMSDDENAPSTPQIRQIRFQDSNLHEPKTSKSDFHKHGVLSRTNSMKHPVTPGESPVLARPASSRSLKSLARAKSNRARRPLSQHMRSLSIGPEEGASLHRRAESALPPFQNDAVIDPDLEPFMSDDNSSDEDATSIAAAISSDAPTQSSAGLHGIFQVLRKRPRTPGKLERQDTDDFSVSSSRVGHRRQHGSRRLSTGSVSHIASSRVGRSDNFLKSSDNLLNMLHRPEIIQQTVKDGSKELDDRGLEHLKSLTRQCLSDADIPSASRWQRALVPILLKCAANVEPNIERGDNMDIRNYIKVKKVASGSPGDSSYVAGIVFTNTVALKAMARSINQPRVLLISFPLIYARHQQHFMSLEGVIAQEREYLRNLTTRIKQLRPNLVLVQGAISGLAKEFLHEADITVVYNVKPSVLQACARVTQSKIVSSVDKLTMTMDQLGQCSTFDSKTYLHGNRRKSYIFLGAAKTDLGATIVLHGPDLKTLTKMKSIVEFLCYVAYHLRLETYLMRDQFAATPVDKEPKRRSHSKPRLKSADHSDSFDIMAADLAERILSVSPSVKFSQPYLMKKGRDQEIQMSRIRLLQQFQEPKSPVDEPTTFELVRPEMVYNDSKTATKQVREILRAIHSAEYAKASSAYNSVRRRWEMYSEDIIDPFSPFNHQRLIFLFSIVSSQSGDACQEPGLLGIEYYQEQDLDADLESDLSLGEYVERVCSQAHVPCTSGRCEKKMIDHHRLYVHGEGQIKASVEKNPVRFKGMENTILMWSKCQVCNVETQVAPMSYEAWKYSLAKYLELSFWSKPIHPRGENCAHDIYRDHVRCFGFKNLTLKFVYESINIIEIVVPRSIISWIVEKDLRLKNEEYTRIESRIGRYMSSVKQRLKNIKLDSIEVEKLESCKLEVQNLLKRANDQYESLTKKLQEKYMVSRFYEIVPLNEAVRQLQEKVAEWDATFADFEATYFPSDKDLRRLATIQFRKTFLDKDDSFTSTQDESKDASLHPGDTLIGSDSFLLEKDALAIDGVLNGMTTALAASQQNDAKIVQSLDLAVPEELSAPIEMQKDREIGTDETKNVIDEPLPLDADLVAKVDQMQTESIDASDVAAAVDSPTKSRARAPPLFRSQTQPQLAATPTSPGKLAVAEPSRIPAALPAEPEPSQLPHKSRASVVSRFGKTAVSMIPRPINPTKDSKVSALAKHFEQMTREFEREKLRERRQRAARTRQSRAFPTASGNPILEVYRDAHEAVGERDVSQATPDPVAADSTGIQETRSASLELQPNKYHEPMIEDSDTNTLIMSYPESIADVTSDPEQATAGGSQEADEELDRQERSDSVDMAKHEKSSFLKVLASLWSEQTSSGWSQLEYPLLSTDHIFVDSDLIVREDEPSSLIAFALSSHDYSNKIQRFRERANAAERVKPDAAPLDEDIGVESVMLGKTATHMRYQFEAGTARMQCKIFYAESFDAIRRKCGVADRFVEALSRCVKWDSKGGKTKSLFLKTLDERFVLKSLSQVETQAFLKFAPDYFDYMSKCLFHHLPSALVKMLGLYQVVIKNPATGTEFNWFLQVMENVFYEGTSNRMFDLKGSMRNRKITSTGEKDEVLLDENLLDYISQTPLYVRYHSNSILQASITNDTLFCSNQNVMDYSLIVGLYEDRKELLVGIIDYIRTYTWDKKLETWIKDRGKHKATVRSPKEYRTRFRRSIPRYFPHAPSIWQNFGVGPMQQSLAQLVAEEEDESDDEEDEAEAEADDEADEGDAEDGEADEGEGKGDEAAAGAQGKSEAGPARG